MAESNTYVCGYKLQRDYATTVPLDYTSLFLKYFVPKDFIWDQNLRKIVECDCFTRLRFGEKAQLEKEVVYAGSSAEGLVIPDFSSSTSGLTGADIDRLNVICNTFYFQLPYEHSEYSSVQTFRVEPIPDGPPNYAYLVPTESFKQARLLSGRPLETKRLSSTPFKQKLKRGFQSIAPKIQHSIHGPAVTSELSVIERDNVPVFSFPGWPNVARDWAVRKRRSGWPTEGMVDRILTSGYYMAGVGRKGTEMEEFEWRYSFNTAEKLLAHSFTKEQRQVYVYMKLLRKFYLKAPGVFPSYWLKTLYFWICEKVSASQFRSDNLGQIILYILDEITHALATKHLPNYFIPSVNMMGMAPRDHLTTTLKQARFVKRNLVDCILKIDKDISFLGMTRGPHEKLVKLFPESITSMRLDPMNAKLFQTSATKGLKRLLEYNLRKFKGLNVFTDDDMLLDRDALRNNIINQTREVLNDLRMFDKCRSNPNETDVVHILEQCKDVDVIARVLVLLEIHGNLSRFEHAKRNLCGAIERLEGNSVVTIASDSLANVKSNICLLNKRDFKNFDNEVIYKLKSIYDSVESKNTPPEGCRQM